LKGITCGLSIKRSGPLAKGDFIELRIEIRLEIPVPHDPLRAWLLSGTSLILSEKLITAVEFQLFCSRNRSSKSTEAVHGKKERRKI
jgi:hypothetical protein